MSPMWTYKWNCGFKMSEMWLSSFAIGSECGKRTTDTASTPPSPVAAAIHDAAPHDAHAAAHATAFIQVHLLRRWGSDRRSQDLYCRLDSICPAFTILPALM